MNITVALLDFDGTLVTRDILDVLCDAVGKSRESEALNEAFHRGGVPGLDALIRRINFLKGMTKSHIYRILGVDNYLMPGCSELMQFLKQRNIVTILASGNIMPVLQYYQELLSIDHIVGSHPTMAGETIEGIDATAFPSKNFKVNGIQAILSEIDQKRENIVAMGDSPADKAMFSLSSYAIAVNPKGDIAEYANAVIGEDLHEAVLLLDQLVDKNN